MDAARDLADRGLHAEALREYLWCFDQGHLEDAAFTGVRLSFLLGEMRELGERYPAALEALRDRRDQAESRILAGADESTSAMEFGRINEKLEESNRSLALFDRLLVERHRNVALRELLDFVLPQLAAARRYEDALAVAHDPLGVVAALLQDLGSNLESFQLHFDEPERSNLTGFFKQSFVEEAADYFEVLLGSGREEEASLCADRIIDAHPTGQSYATLIAHAAHAGAYDAARSVAARGLRSLPEAERAAVAEAAGAIPSSIE